LVHRCTTGVIRKCLDPTVLTYPDRGSQARTPRRSALRQRIEQVTCPSARHSAGLPGG